MDPLSLAIEVAREAGALLLAQLDAPLEMNEKSARDLVTSADRASEELIVRRLHAAFPAATILGEEGGARAGTSDERWIVDPLDGTTNYAHRYPLYCISVGYERAGELRCGVVYAPSMGELYAAELGAGATCNDRRIGVSQIAVLREALVCTGFNPANYDRNGTSFAALARRSQGVRRDGAAALDLAFLAAGRFDGFWEYDLKPWDLAAGVLLVREAGGRVTAGGGAPHSFASELVVASNGRVHGELVAELAAAV